MNPTTPTVNNIYTPRQRYTLLIVALIVIGLLALYGLLGYLTAFLGAGILYVVFRPWFTALVHKRKWNRALVTVLLIVFAVVVLVIPFFGLTSLLIDRVRELAQHTDEILAVVQRIERRLGVQVTEQAQVRQRYRHRGLDALYHVLPIYAGGSFLGGCASLPALSRKHNE
jgi:predicted PurR-regulated permease PerM